jgi:hypothetical protein
MTNSDPLRAYLHTLRQNVSTGAATEHTHRPALQSLLESLAGGIRTVNEPQRIACGAPDLLVTRDGLTAGYVETKDIGTSLHETARTEQLRRYRRSLENLLLTDYLDFYWYVDGNMRESARLAKVQSGGLATERGGAIAVQTLLQSFLCHAPQQVNTPRELAERMARLTHLIRDIVVQTFETDRVSNLLRGWRSAFARVLVADLDQPEKTSEFADMFAQTLAYGLFSARVMDLTPGFDRREAQHLIPKTNPLLRQFFYEITGPQMDDEPYVSFVDDLAAVLANTDMEAVLADFGKRTRQEDPVVHFYETFLAAYDPRLREARGVYYTPEPVVSYIVRSVDHLLKTRFDCPQGLADTSKVTIRNVDPGRTVRGTTEMRKTAQSHKVLILDPAAGTGTFLYAVVDHIREQFMRAGNAGMWSGYVREHLLPRLFGFELLMAPYAVAHFKLALQLAGYDLSDAQRGLWAYDFASGERIQVYLTNTLEGPHEYTGLPLFTQFLADETQAANQIKQDLPIMVVIGNPPYSVSSANKGEYIERLMDRYKDAVRSERNLQPLSDDYIKFIRFAHDRIERSGHGVIGMITNHAYLSGLLHRGLREELMKSFDEIYVLNLHGNALMGEVTPDGGLDQNVFDIRQGVAIVLAVRRPGRTSQATNTPEVYHADLWGSREAKYRYLLEGDFTSTDWRKLQPVSPHFFFVPKDLDLQEEYASGWSVSDVFQEYATGFATHRDRFAVDFDDAVLRARISRFRDLSLSDHEARERFGLKDTRDWKLPAARRALMGEPQWEDHFTQCLYRPFDIRHIYYSAHVIEFPRSEVMGHLQQSNMAITTTRMIKGEDPHHAYVTRHPTEKILLSSKTSNNAFVFPLYLYSKVQQPKADIFANVKAERRPNLSRAFVADVVQKTALEFAPDGSGDLGCYRPDCLIRIEPIPAK